MATIHRHPIPADSYQPDRPLNDLGRDQLKHFIHVAERLPPELRVDLPIPSPEDGLAASRYIGAVTERLMSRRRSPLRVVSRQSKKAAKKGALRSEPGEIGRLAASATAASAPAKRTKEKSSKARKSSARR